MGIKTENGFTIIEVMLFLGVTGLLTVAILVGSGVAIGQQRYRDSVNSLKSYIQQQYNETTNVVNSRNAAWACNSVADVVENESGAGQPRGRSDCVILGRFVTIDESGTKMTTSSVVGYRTAGADTASSDIQELVTNYRFGTSPINQEEIQVGWGAQVVKPNTTTPMPVSLLIVRSPLSGVVMTFTADGVKTNLKEMMTEENLAQTKNLCVNADIGTFVGSRMAVQVTPYASNQGSILIPTEGTSICD